jgi:BirA family transcriptional regulator, biotin operon repressor / biotin---[acetyl-CoA-carboxylase] ligase
LNIVSDDDEPAVASVRLLQLLHRTDTRRARIVTTDAQILSALRGTDGKPVSAAELSQNIGITTTALHARIECLRDVGYEIESHPHRGYRLTNSPETLNGEDLRARVGNVKVIGRDIQVFQETSSTNDVVEKLARDGVKEGVVVFAESQSRGRGRLGRVWSSPARRGLWFSVLLRPGLSPQEATQITVAAATAVWRGIHSVTGLKPEIKWPNDVLIGGKKVVGILTEMSAEADRVRHITLGIGVDVNIEAGEFPPELRNVATSLRIETGAPVSRAELAAALLRELDRDYARVCGGGFATLADEWEARCTTIGRQVVVMMGERKLRGRAEALDDDGTLLVRTEHGRLERIIGGDVTLEK